MKPYFKDLGVSILVAAFFILISYLGEVSGVKLMTPSGIFFTLFSMALLVLGPMKPDLYMIDFLFYLSIAYLSFLVGTASDLQVSFLFLAIVAVVYCLGLYGGYYNPLRSRLDMNVPKRFFIGMSAIALVIVTHASLIK